MREGGGTMPPPFALRSKPQLPAAGASILRVASAGMSCTVIDFASTVPSLRIRWTWPPP